MSKSRCDWLTAASSLTTGGPAPLLSGLAINLPGLRKDLRSPNNDDWQQKENKFIKIHRRQPFRRVTLTSFLRDGVVVLAVILRCRERLETHYPQCITA